MLDQLSRFTILKLSFKESILEHQSGGKAVEREAGSEVVWKRAVHTCQFLTATHPALQRHCQESCGHSLTGDSGMVERPVLLASAVHRQIYKPMLIHL